MTPGDGNILLTAGSNINYHPLVGDVCAEYA